MTEIETFEVIPSYESYSISKGGKVINNKTMKVLRQYEGKSGYMRVALRKDKKQKRESVHRLVGITYIENKEELPQINHKDGDKKNNNVSNLEWVTAKQNQQHRRYVLKRGNVKVRCVETGIVYDSIKQASVENQSYIPNIVRACKNGSTAKKLHWEYV